MVKVISLSNEAYERLKVLKGKDKSFSDVVIEVTVNRKKKNLMDFFGIWKDDKYWDDFNDKIRKSRDKAKLRGVKF